MKKENGITLMTLVITIIVLLIISTIGLTVGNNSYQLATFTAFTTEMKMMQSEVNELYQRYKNGEVDILEIGVDLSNSSIENQAFSGAEITDKTGYRYYNYKTLQNLGIEEIKQEFYVNIEERMIISCEGHEYEGKRYYTIDQLPDKFYNVEFQDTNRGNIVVDNVILESSSDSSWKVTIEGIKYPGYVEKGKIEYQKEGSFYWNTISGQSFEIREPGLYYIKITDANGNCKIVNTKGELYENNQIPVYAYVKSGLVLYLDGEQNTKEGKNSETNLWEDLSGNEQHMTLSNFNDNETSGWRHNGLQFDGIDDFAYMVDNEILRVNNQTIEVIIQQDKIMNNERSIFFVKWPGYTMELNPNNIVTYGRNNGYLASNTKIELGKICSIVGAHSYNLSKLYMNGKLENTQTITPIDYTNADLTIGSYNNQLFLNGKIYSIRMYQRELSEEELAINYHLDQVRYQI